MVTERFDDGEGELLRRIRAIDPDTPLCVAYDMHANVFDPMVRHAQVITGYQTYPHIDQRQTAERAARALLRVIAGEVTPTAAWGDRADAAARDGAGHPPGAQPRPAGDVRQHGRPAAVPCPPACSSASRMRMWKWPACRPWWSPTTIRRPRRRWWTSCCPPPGRPASDFLFDIEPLEASVGRAKALGAPGELPVVLLDHYDNCASGGTMDTTDVLREILRQGLEDVVFFGIYDPAAVEQAVQAGVGATVTLSIGAKLPMPQLPVASAPLEVTGTVQTISSGRFRLKGGLTPGLEVFMGRTVVLDTGPVQIVLLSRHIEPTAQEMLQVLGIDPARKQFVAIKSRVHWRADLGKIAREIVECAGVGVCTSDYGQLTFRKVRRPVFPLDPDLRWNRGA